MASAFRSAAELGHAYAAGEETPPGALEAALDRIAALDPHLNAFRAVLTEEARAAAVAAQERLDAGETGPLLGIPVAVKDNTAVAGEVTAQGTGAFGAPATDDAELVRRLRQAGAVIVGLTHVPEFAFHPFTESVTWGASRNPWDPARSAGGSSGGSGVAVAAGMVPLAHATDGGGSIRLPAAFNGLFGLKPTRGLVSLAPYAEHWHGLSTANCVARTVEDSALFLDVVADDPHPDYRAAARAEPGRLRIGWTLTPPLPTPIAGEVKDAVRATARLLSELGHDVREATPDWGFQVPAFLPRVLAGLRKDAAEMPHPERLERRTRQLLALARYVSEDRVEASKRAGERIAERLGRSFDDFDVVLTPTAPRLPEPVGRFAGASVLRTANHSSAAIAFTAPWNVAGHPAAAVPAGLAASGLPLSVQLVGRPRAEETLLSLAAQLESARPWADKEPPLRV